MKARLCLVLFLSAMPPLLTGCQRLNDERTVSVSLGDPYSIEYSAPRYEQKVTIQVSSPGAPVSAYLVAEPDRQAAQLLLNQKKTPEKSLAGKEKAEEFTLEATVPAKTAFVLLIRADKKEAQVRVKATGR